MNWVLLSLKKITKPKYKLESMDGIWILFTFLFITVILLRCCWGSDKTQLPPGPRGWPIVGNIFTLGELPHRSLAALKAKYGPIVWLKLGSINTMVILTADVATELFKNHDVTFADRSITEAFRSHDFHKSSLAAAPYGMHLRLLRRICTTEMFVNKRINEAMNVREKCVNELLDWIGKEADKAQGIHVAHLVFLTSFNLIGNLVLSRDLVDPRSKVGSQFFTALTGISEWLGKPNISDFLPWLRWFDLQGIRKNMDQDLGKALEIASGFVKERIQQRETIGARNMDFLDVLLDYEGKGKDEPAKLSERIVTVFILAQKQLINSTIEWAILELIRHPKAMIKVKDELVKIVGMNKKLEEKSADNLPYLQAVIKETLRLHAPVPFLLPRRAVEDTIFMGYKVPKGTQVFVNAWAIGNDQERWDDSSCFKPERFLGSKFEFQGQHFEMIPFGAGRRMCPAVPLVDRILPLVLGSLLHEFDWELDRCVDISEIDMKEKMGLALRKLEPLIVVPKRSMQSSSKSFVLFE